MLKYHTRIPILVLILMISLLSACNLITSNTGTLPLPVLAEKPPMGWNSYMCFANDVNEEQVKAAADYMAAHLKEYGWEYIVIDVDWYKSFDSTEVRGGVASMDAYGRFIPDAEKFPSSVNGGGFKPLADYMHDKGLKLGVHIMRGIPAQAVQQKLRIYGTKYHAHDIAEPNNGCDWNASMMGINMTHPAGPAYYQSVVDLFDEWGIDYVKADDMTARLYQVDDLNAMGSALKNSKRGIVFSLSPGPAPVGAVSHLRKNAHLWRISNDYWDSWHDLERQFGLCAQWAPYIEENKWPDADMLPIGKLRKTGIGEWEANRLNTTPEEATDEYSRFTPDEQITMMNLWAIFKSPLMIGGYLPENDDFTLSLITNQALLELNQESINNKAVYYDENKSVWTADSKDGCCKYLAVFNLSDGGMTENFDLAQVHLEKNKGYAFEDIWSKKTQVVKNQLSLVLNQHASVLYRIDCRAGMK